MLVIVGSELCSLNFNSTLSPDLLSLSLHPTPTLIIISLHSPECESKAAVLKTNQLISLAGHNFRNILTFALFNDYYETKQHMNCAGLF